MLPVLVAASQANDEERKRLALFPGEMVYRLDRTRGEGEQLLVESRRLALALFPSLQNPVPRISELAAAYGLHLGEALERVCAFPASADIAKTLGVRESTLLLMSDRLVHLRDRRPAEWRITYRLVQQNLARLLGRL
jgi:DNA-binding GntR family transcriptional regulator